MAAPLFVAAIRAFHTEDIIAGRDHGASFLGFEGTPAPREKASNRAFKRAAAPRQQVARLPQSTFPPPGIDIDATEIARQTRV